MCRDFDRIFRLVFFTAADTGYSLFLYQTCIGFRGDTPCSHFEVLSEAISKTYGDNNLFFRRIRINRVCRTKALPVVFRIRLFSARLKLLWSVDAVG